VSATRAQETLITAEEGVVLGGVSTRRLLIEGGGTPFLFVHGFGDSADTWRPVMRELGARGRAAAAFDLGGFGAAFPLATNRGLLEQWDAMVDEAVTELSAAHGGSPVYVVGNSLGGCLSIRAAQRPDLPVAGIVPVAPAGLDMARWLPIIEGQRLIQLLNLSPIPVPEVIVREVVGRVFSNLAYADQSRVDPEVIAAFTSHVPSVARGNAILEIGRRLLPELQSPFELKLIDCPLLLVWGEHDRLVYTTGAERVLRTVPYSDIEIVPDCGHCPQLELPAEVARMLLDFPEGYEHP
jgi:pimeloyl-ACP methyl ester carboxylesterase